MSSKTSGAIWDLDLPPSDKYVLLAMADHADHVGRNIYPSVRFVSWKTGLSERQINRIIASLRAAGLLVLEQHNDETGRSNLYRVNVEAGLTRPPFEHKSRAAKAKEVGHGVIPTSDTMADPPPKRGMTRRHTRSDTVSYQVDQRERKAIDVVDQHERKVIDEPPLTPINQGVGVVDRSPPTPHASIAHAREESPPDVRDAALSLLRRLGWQGRTGA